MFEVISHHFSSGVYAKIMRIREGGTVTTHKHKYDHMGILASGCVILDSGTNREILYSPIIVDIKAGVAHSIEAVNGPVVWICIHATDCTDEEQIDETLIQKPGI